MNNRKVKWVLDINGFPQGIGEAFDVNDIKNIINEVLDEREKKKNVVPEKEPTKVHTIRLGDIIEFNNRKMSVNKYQEWCDNTGTIYGLQIRI